MVKYMGVSKRVTYIEWVDSHVSGDWTAEDSVDHIPPKIKAIGFLLKSDSDGVTLVGFCDDEDGQVNSIMNIPAGCITKMETFELDWLLECLMKKKSPLS